MAATDPTQTPDADTEQQPPQPGTAAGDEASGAGYGNNAGTDDAAGSTEQP